MNKVRPEGRCTAQELLEMNNRVNNAPHLQVQLQEKSPTELCMWLNSGHDQVEGWQESWSLLQMTIQRDCIRLDDYTMYSIDANLCFWYVSR